MSVMGVVRFLQAKSKGTTSAVPNPLHLSPEMLRLLQEAAEHLEGHVKIERFREGVWPVELRVLRGLQKDGYLQLIATRDQPSKGKVTATYAITPEGRKVAARLASQDA
jgi:hypothetical protein